MTEVHTPQESVALEFLTAWANRDLETVAHLLDPTVTFRSPANDLTGKDRVVPVLKEFAQVVQGLDVRLVTSAGPDVVVLYDMHTAPFGTMRVAEHFVINEGRITRDNLVFDTAPMASKE